MQIGIGIQASVACILFAMFWYLGLKQTIAGAMFLGMIITYTSNGVNQILATLANSPTDTTQESIMTAIALFTVMASVTTKTNTINYLVNILSSLLGRARGDSTHVSAYVGGLFGMVAGASSTNSATVDSVTVPWILESGQSKDAAVTMNTGNVDFGICGPAASSLFLMLNFAPIAQAVNYGDLYLPLLHDAFWALVYRLLTVRHYISEHKIPTLSSRAEKSSVAIRQGGASLLVLLGIIVPLLLTIGLISSVLENQVSLGEKAVGAISIITWISVLIMSICLVLGRKLLPKTWDGWEQLPPSTSKIACSYGAVSLFASTGSPALTLIGFGGGLSTLLGGLNLPKVVMILLIGFVIALVAGPLNTTAATVNPGLVAHSAMVVVGVPLVTAVIVFSLFVSTEGCSPPMSSPIFISSSIAGVENISVMLGPSIFHYLIPLVLVGALVVLGFLPIIEG